MNHISNQGTLSATAPAVLRGEEPLDYNSLISIKTGGTVLAYKREQDTNAVYVLVLLSAVLTIVNNSYYILNGMRQFFGYILAGYHEYYKNYNVI